MKMGRFELSVFVCGAALMVLEITGSRIIAPYLGASIYSWSGIIAVILGALSLGYWYGGRLADKSPDEKFYFFVVLLCGASVLFVPVVVPIAMYFAVPLGIKYGPLFASLILFALPAFLFGLVSPFAVRLKTKAVGEVGSVAGFLYSISTFGSIVGTLLAGFVLIPGFGVKATLVAVSFVVVFMALYYLRSLLASVLFLAMFAVAVFSPDVLFARAGKMVFQADSEYYHLAVMDSDGTRSLILDSDSQSIINLNPEDFLYSYVRAFVFSRAFIDSPNRILLFGMGAGSIGRYFLESTNASVDVLEIDPKVVEIGKTYFGFSPPRGRCEIYVQDGRAFLNGETGDGAYDVIFVDVYSSHWSIPQHTTTLEAVRGMRKKLKPGGIIVANVISAVEGRRAGVFRAIYSTYREVFPKIYVFPTEPGDLEEVQNVVFFATAEGTEFDVAKLLELQEKFFPEGGPELYAGQVEPGILLTDDYAPLENLLASSFE